ncbi:MAG: LuxR family transcriptional regulator, partial [Nitrospinota bacterium]
AYIRQLCCLGLGGQIVIPAVLQQLHTLVSSYGNTFFWIDDQHQIVNMYDETSMDPGLISRYLQEYVDKAEQEVMPSVSEWLRTGGEITTTERFVSRRFYESALYHEIFHPLRYHHTAYVFVREQERILGILALHRAPGESRYTAREERLLVSLIPYLAHALHGPEEGPYEVIEGRETGLLVFHPSGRLEYLSRQGSRLLFLATHPRVSAQTVRPARGPLRVPADLVRLCQVLQGVFNGDPHADRPPVWHHRNPWGQFTFRAYWLEPLQGEQGLIGITVQRHEPVLLSALRQMQALGLSAREMEVGMGVFRGLAPPEIAGQLYLSVHTVLDHIRRLYSKLGVHSREELVKVLLQRKPGEGGEAAIYASPK